jgi:cobyrinic acid a,c-diamide synthase
MASRCLLIAGTHSGVGKTTIALGLMAALRQRGLVVQPFKVGPDFIDPGHHTAVCGRVSRNLDTWMLSEEYVRATFARASTDADVAVIEGVMGLFDGRGPDDSRGSTADVARLLGVPVVLIVDAGAMAGSVAALVKGFATFDPAVRVAGVICNRVAGARHYEYLEPAIRRHTDVVPLGWLPRREEWRVPERHLGLTTAEDLAGTERWQEVGAALAETVDVAKILEQVGR